MRMTRIAALTLALGLVASAVAQPPSAQDVLRKAAAAARTLNTVAYDANFTSEGPVAAMLPGQMGRVTMARSTAGLPKVRADTWSLAGDGSAQVGVEVVCDGSSVGAIYHTKRQYTQQTGTSGNALLAHWGGLFVWDLTNQNPFYRELASKDATYVGTQKVGDVECDVVSIDLDDGKVNVRWYFGRDDGLPRRMERTLSEEVGGGKVILALDAVSPNLPLADDTFVFQPPPDYDPRDARSLSRTPQPMPNEPRRLLHVGDDAPDFSLQTPDGKTVTLKEQRGKVVLLDFWATWCRPCRMAMPGLQKIHEHYQKRPVAVFGVSTSERSDPAKFMEASGFTYGLLLKGDAVAQAYRVIGLPTFYLIGPDGKVLYAAAGYGNEDKLKELIDRTLKNMDRSEPEKTSGKVMGP